MANFAWDKRSHSDGINPSKPEEYVPLMTLLCPVDTTIKGWWDNASEPDQIQVPSGTGKYYTVHYVDLIGCQFENAHLGAEVYMNFGGVPSPPPSIGFIAEDGDPLAAEDGVLLGSDAS